MTQEELLVKLGLDNSAMAAGLRRSMAMVREAGAEMSKYFKEKLRDVFAPVAGLFGVEKLREGLKSAIEYGSEVKRLAEETGVTTQFIQGLEGASIKLGLSFENTSAALAVLVRKIGDARNGGESADLFKKWGIDVEGKTTEQLFFEIADKMKSIGSESERMAMAFDLGGRSAKDLAVALAQGSENLHKLVDETEKLSDSQIETLHRAETVLNKIGREAKLKAAELFTALLPPSAPQGHEEEVRHLAAKLFNLYQDRAAGRQVTGLERSALLDFAYRNAIAIVGQKIENDQAAAAAAAAVGQPGKVDPADARAAADMNKQAAALEREGLLKAIPLKERIVALQNEYKTAVQDWMAVVDDGDAKDRAAARLRVDNVKKELDQTKALSRAVQERIAFEKRHREEERLAPFMPTIEELATAGVRTNFFRNGRFVGSQLQQSPFAGEAREILRLQQDAHDSLFFGNTARAKADVDRIDQIKAFLRKAGVIGNDQRLESIDENIKRLGDRAAGKDGGVAIDLTTTQ